MNVRPLRDKIIVRRSAPRDVTPGGIHLPERSVERPSEGTVVAVGPGRVTASGRVEPVELAVGDRVLFGKHDGAERVIDGEKYVFLAETEVIAVVEE